MSLRMRIAAASMALICTIAAHAASSLPKEIAGWQAWVQEGQEYLRCPLFAESDANEATNHVCAWPGRLSIDLDSRGGRFTQTWLAYAEEWIALPGSIEYWPSGVTVNGRSAAVVARDAIPYIRVAAGSVAVSGNFSWARRPESLPIPRQTALLSLTVDGKRLDPADRQGDSLWLGKRRDAAVEPRLDVQVYRLLADGIPMLLTTRVNLQVAGDGRELTLGPLLPAGFETMTLSSELPARLDADGRLRLQIRAGTWTITVTARGAVDSNDIVIPTANGIWPNEEIWSYATDDRLRFAALQGGDSIDPAQADVPRDWRQYPSYRLASGDVLKVIERSRGASLEDGNHLNLTRDLYLDFDHAGFTVVDHFTGQMRSGWRLDMRAPYRLLRASTGTLNLLVTQSADAALAGVELRSPNVNLETVSRIPVNGTMAAAGWTHRLDHMTGRLNLPPGHRLLAVLGADSAPGAWLEGWGLLDLFILALAGVLALRLHGPGYAAATLLATASIYQEAPIVVWLLAALLLVLFALKFTPQGWPRCFATGLRNLLFVGVSLFVVAVAAGQLKFALYPQLAACGGEDVVELGNPLASVQRYRPRTEGLDAPAAALSSVSRFATTAPTGPLNEITVTGAKQALSKADSPPYAPRRYAPGTVVQAGPAVPQWGYARYTFEWTGPVDATQTVRFIIVPPWLVGTWRVMAVVLLIGLCVKAGRGSLDLRQRSRAPSLPAAAVILVCMTTWAAALYSGAARADTTPDRALLEELKTRLAQPPKCLPTCAELMAARIALTASTLDASLDVAALTNVALALPTTGQRFDPDSISLDGVPISGLYRDPEQQIWIALKPGAHVVAMRARLPAADSSQLIFPQLPRTISVSGEGWTVSGINAGRLLGNTLELTRRQRTAAESTPSNSLPLSPFLRIRREFAFDLDWTLSTTAERLAPERGGFTMHIPLLSGESILTAGVETSGHDVLLGFDSGSSVVTWRSGLVPSNLVTLTASAAGKWSETWLFHVSPIWHAVFSGLPAVLPDNPGADEWTYEYHPRAGETLTIAITRPLAALGGALAVDAVLLDDSVGKRSSETSLTFTYRSTRGDRFGLELPQSARIMSATMDGVSFPLQMARGVLPMALLPGTHNVRVRWQSDQGAALRTRTPTVDLRLPTSNVTTVMRLPEDRWVLYAGGSGVGPAFVYWGELIAFCLAAVALRRLRVAPLRVHEWLLLGLGLGTFAWPVLALFAVWIFAMQWRESARLDNLTRRRFNSLQAGLILLTLFAVSAVVIAIPFGLLGTPTMGVAGGGQSSHVLHWFNDQTTASIPTAWVWSVSSWWYKAAMLLWALWVASALTRWLPRAWHALGTGGLWRQDPLRGAKI